MPPLSKRQKLAKARARHNGKFVKTGAKNIDVDPQATNESIDGDDEDENELDNVNLMAAAYGTKSALDFLKPSTQQSGSGMRGLYSKTSARTERRHEKKRKEEAEKADKDHPRKLDSFFSPATAVKKTQMKNPAAVVQYVHGVDRHTWIKPSAHFIATISKPNEKYNFDLKG